MRTTITKTTVVETTNSYTFDEEQAKILILRALKMRDVKGSVDVEFVIGGCGGYFDGVVVTTKHRAESKEDIPDGQDQDR